MSYRRNDEALKEALESHTVDGYEVVVPVLNEAVILDQGGTGPVKHFTTSAMELGSPMVYYQVKAKHPVPFKSWVDSRLGRDAFNKLNRDEWIARSGKRLEHQYKGVYLPMADYLRDKIEAGGSVSPADVEHDDLVHRGCIDADDRVNCYTFWQNQVLIDPRQLRPGMLVEYEENGKESQPFQGAIAGFSKDRKVAFLELFTPIPYLYMPVAISNEDIQKTFYPDVTYAIGFGTYEAFEEAAKDSGEAFKIPPGKWDREIPKESLIYTLKEFMPLSVISELCSAACGDQPHCLWQSLIMYVVPVVLDGVEVEGKTPSENFTVKGTWRPLPEKVVQVDAVISYEDEDEG